ncbi:MAG: polyphosphate kinase 2 family protein [Candidatus Aquilonibacter sp.]
MKSIDHSGLLVKPGCIVNLANFDPGATYGFKHKDDASEKLCADIKRLSELQEVFYASGQRALLIILQGTDSAGKDGAIKHVMTGVNPQGVEVHGFKVPSTTELSHDYLWRTTKVLPERGRIGIFNRSYYAEVVVVRIHQAVLENERLPPGSDANPALWKERYEDISAFERHMSRNGTRILKFFLHLSKDEQRKRLLKRVETPDKQWKLSSGDIHERKFWDRYQRAYAESLSHTSTEWAPWYVVPADHKWFARVAIASVIVAELEALNLSYPAVTAEQRANLAEIRKELEEADPVQAIPA